MQMQHRAYETHNHARDPARELVSHDAKRCGHERRVRKRLDEPDSECQPHERGTRRGLVQKTAKWEGELVWYGMQELAMAERTVGFSQTRRIFAIS